MILFEVGNIILQDSDTLTRVRTMRVVADLLGNIPNRFTYQDGSSRVVCGCPS
jgi:hypothetical protein